MSEANLQTIRKRIPAVINRLESTVYSAANAVRSLRTPNSHEYAEAVLDQNGFGGDTAEIYFFKYAPEGFPKPRDQEEYQALMSDTSKKRAYDRSCFAGWKGEIGAVEATVVEYDGSVEVNGYRLTDFLSEVQESGQIPDHRVHVKISVPGQEDLRKLRELVDE